jgi:deoxyribose-phosphate aldolase
MASTADSGGKKRRESRASLSPVLRELAARIEHTALQPGLLQAEVEQRCLDAKTYGFAGVCLPPFFVEKAAELLEGSAVRVVTVAGFPMGYSTTSAKVEEARKAFDQGARELDMVINIAALKNGRFNTVRDDIQSLAVLAGMNNRVLKVILETALLTPDEIRRACAICAEVGVGYAKTSTGFHGQGATPEIIALMRAELPASVRIKASGGIRTRAQAEALVAVGADRLGTSNGLALLELEAEQQTAY